MDDDTQLMGRVQQGDCDALCILIKSWTPRVAPLLTRLLGSATDVDDVTNEAFLKVWSKCNSYSVESGVEPYYWFRTIARYCAIDWVRRQKGNPVSFRDPSDLDFLMTSERDRKSDTSDPFLNSSDADIDNALASVYSNWNSLHPREKAVARADMRHPYGKAPAAALAREFGVSKSAIYKYRSKYKKKLGLR